VLVEPWATADAGETRRDAPRSLDSALGSALVRLEPPVGWNVHEGLLPPPRAWTAPVVPVRMGELVRLAKDLGSEVPAGLWIVRMSRHGGYLSIAEGVDVLSAFVDQHLPANMASARAWQVHQSRLEQRLDPKGILNPDG